MLTPLRADLSPDAALVVRHCRALLARGCDGINLLGTTGEAASLSVAQRSAVMESVAASELPLERFMVGTGASALGDAIVLTARALEFGFAKALVIPPFYFKNVSENGIFAYYSALVEAVGRPELRLYLYNFPALSGVAVTPALMERLVLAFPGAIAGVKDSSGDAAYARRVRAAFPALDVFPSSEASLSIARREGYAGCISATVNVTAPLAAEVWSERDEKRRESLQRGLTRLRDTMAAYPLVPAVRQVMALATSDAAWLRLLPPLEALDPGSSADLAAALAAQPAFGPLRAAIEDRTGEEA